MRAQRRLSTLALACLVLAACRSTLRSNLSEFEANQLLIALDTAAIAAQKVPQSGAHDRYTVEVPTAASTRALAVLEAQRLPRRAAPGFEQLFGEAGMWSTPDQERARVAAAVAGELARSIERMQGVVDARVHLALAERPSALDVRAPDPKAAVLIRHLSAGPSVDEHAVRALVAGAVDGLSPERVTIVQVEVPTSPSTAEPAFVYLGPLAIERHSAGLLKGLLAASLVFDLALASALIWVTRRKRA